MGKLFLQAAQSLLDAVRSCVVGSYSHCVCSVVGLNHEAGRDLTSLCPQPSYDIGESKVRDCFSIAEDMTSLQQ